VQGVPTINELKAPFVFTSTNEMASYMSETVFINLKAEMENAMRKLVTAIAEGEGLDTQQLMDKYLSDLPAPKAKKTRKAKVTVVEDPDATQDPNAPLVLTVACSCLTAKGKPCTLKPKPGMTMCGIHAKKAATDAIAAAADAVRAEQKANADVDEAAPSDEEAPAPKPKRKYTRKPKAPVPSDEEAASEAEEAPKPKRKYVRKPKPAAAEGEEAAPKPKRATKKKVVKETPMHTHELDDEIHDDCELCQSHGCPLAEQEEEYEIVTSPPMTLRARLARASIVEEEFVEDDE
jgi:hypothetical protein